MFGCVKKMRFQFLTAMVALSTIATVHANDEFAGAPEHVVSAAKAGNADTNVKGVGTQRTPVPGEHTLFFQICQS